MHVNNKIGFNFALFIYIKTACFWHHVLLKFLPMFYENDNQLKEWAAVFWGTRDTFLSYYYNLQSFFRHIRNLTHKEYF